MSDAKPTRTPVWARATTWAAAVAVVVVLVLAAEFVATRPVREAVRIYFELIAAANRGDVDGARKLCTDRFLRTHPVRQNVEGGIEALPRIIHMNYRAWRKGPDVLICPTKQEGPVYRFVKRPEGWRFDGVIGMLMKGQVVPFEDKPQAGSDGNRLRSRGFG